MKTRNTPLDRLFDLARQGGDEAAGRPLSAPPGFATRVVARSRLGEGAANWMGLLEGRAWRALGLALGVAMLSVAVNFEPISQALHADVLEADDPMVALLDLS